MKYKTRGDSSPQGKPRVYITEHPEDVKLYFESITDVVLKLHDCAIFYDEDPEHPEDAENFISDLDRMQLIVLVVTSRYVYGDTFAHNTVFRHAMEHHIPVLPILEERGIEEDFNRKCGDLQYLDPNARDDTAISFEEKLKKFLDSVLVGEELADKVRAAFDAYIFLSYRKKDRRYAQQLMHLIHQNPFCRDIAIWYDEFLVPGENFNDAIRKAMEKSELFALVVTPSLLEDPNYIMSTEYPAAREAGMPVLPAMLVPTDGGELAARYENIPTPVDPAEEGALSAALRRALAAVTVPGNDDEPQHIFFIGLAYLGGIDVEVNYEFAVQLITRAAEAGLPEAIEKLVSMYRTGEGVARDYHKAIHWQEKLVKARHAAYEAAPAAERGQQWFNALLYLGDFWYELRLFDQADKVYRDMLKASRDLNTDYLAERLFSISYNRLGDISRAQGDLAGARAFYEKGLAIFERLAAETGTVGARRDLSIIYDRLGNISQAQGDLTGAKAFYEKGLAIREQLKSETGTVQARRDLSISFERLGDISQFQGDLAGAKAFYEKGLTIREQLAAGTGAVQARRDLSISFERLGDISQTQGDLAGAKAFYEKGLTIREQLAAETGTVQARRDLSINRERLGDIGRAQGDLAGAKALYEQGFAIREQLAAETGTVQARRDLSVSYDRLGDISRAQGDLTGAKAFYEKGLTICEQLESETGTVEMRRDLSISYDRMGDISQAQGDLAQAKTFFKKGLAICEQLAAETDTVGARRDLSISCNNLGNVSQAQGDLAGAKAFYERGLAIFEQLELETGTVEARRGLSSCYEKLGDISQAQGDLAQAKTFFKKSFAIRERLAAETDAVEARRDLFVSYEKLGDISQAQGDLAGAKALYEQGLAISERLATEADTVEARRDLFISYERLGNVSCAQGDLAGAKAFYEKSLAASKQLAAEIRTITAYDDLAISYYNVFCTAKTAEEEQEYLRKAERIWSRLAAQCPDVPLYAERLALVRK